MSVQSKHTPGPWRVTIADPIRQPGVLPCIDAPTAEVACGVFREEDAELIAVAPEMAEALANFRTWFANHFADFDEEVNSQLLCLDNEAAAILARL